MKPKPETNDGRGLNEAAAKQVKFSNLTDNQKEQVETAVKRELRYRREMMNNVPIAVLLQNHFDEMAYRKHFPPDHDMGTKGPYWGVSLAKDIEKKLLDEMANEMFGQQAKEAK